MSELATLQALTNKQLHEKCLQYGLPNIPVTDSSRSVLIRKLLSAMTSKPETKTKRRETVHTTKPEKNATVPAKSATPRRRTVNAAAKQGAASDGEEQSGSVLSVDREKQRRNVTIGATQFTRRPLSTAPLTKSGVMSTSCDQDYSGPQYRAPKATQSADTDTESVHSNRSSVSLSRSEIVTTSYRQELAPLPRQLEMAEEEYDDEDYEYDEDEEEVEAMDVDDAYVSGNISGNLSKRTQHMMPLYSEKELIPNPFQHTLNSTAKSPSLPHHHTRQTYYNDNESLGQTTSFPTRSYTAVEPDGNSFTQSPLNFNVASAQSSAYQSFREPEIKRYTNNPTQSTTTTDSFSRADRKRYTVNSGNTAPSSPTNSTLYPSLSGFYQPPSGIASTSMHSQLDDDILETENDESDIETDHDPHTGAYSKLFQSEMAAPRKRRNLHDPDSVEGPLREFIGALERKYHLKQLFALIACFVLACLVYSFFLAKPI